MEVKEIAEQVAAALSADFKEDRQLLRDLVKQATLSRIVSEVENYTTAALSNQYSSEFSEIIAATIKVWIESGALKVRPTARAKRAFERTLEEVSSPEWERLFPARDWQIYIAHKSKQSTKKELAEQFDVSQTRVNQIIRRVDRDVQRTIGLLESVGYTVSPG